MRLLLGNMVLANAVGLTMRWAMVVDMGSATEESLVQCRVVDARL